MHTQGKSENISCRHESTPPNANAAARLRGASAGGCRVHRGEQSVAARRHEAILLRRSVSSSHRARGFTLVELLAAMGVAAVLATIAAPSLSKSIARNRCYAAAELVAAEVASARAIAQQTSRPASVSFNEYAEQCGASQWVIHSGGSVDRCMASTDFDQRFKDVLISADASAIQFNGVGMVVPMRTTVITLANDASKVQLTILPSGAVDLSHETR